MALLCFADRLLSVARQTATGRDEPLTFPDTAIRDPGKLPFKTLGNCGSCADIAGKIQLRPFRSVVEQVLHRHTQRSSKRLDGIERGIPAPALNTTHVAASKSAAIGKKLPGTTP